MNPVIKPKSSDELKLIIQKEINEKGINCDLNHIDVCAIQDMSYLFYSSEFNGDISKWDVSGVITMQGMFFESHFNNDISSWDVSNVDNMREMFCSSLFNQDISRWNVSNVKNMQSIFEEAVFNQDISNWDVSNVTQMNYAFLDSDFSQDLTKWRPIKLVKDQQIFNSYKSKAPYWAQAEDIYQAIREYTISEQYKELNNTVEHKNSSLKKKKI